MEAGQYGPLRAVVCRSQQLSEQCLELDGRLRVLPLEETLLAAKDAGILPSDGVAKALNRAIVQMELEHVWRGHTGSWTQDEVRIEGNDDLGDHWGIGDGQPVDNVSFDDAWAIGNLGTDRFIDLDLDRGGQSCLLYHIDH
jgi:hypothetical protein